MVYIPTSLASCPSPTLVLSVFRQVAGYGATCDAHHITAPAPDGNGLARAIEASMKMGDIKPEVMQCTPLKIFSSTHPTVLSGAHSNGAQVAQVFF